MKNLFLIVVFFLGTTFLITSCDKDDDACTESTWYQDADGDGLGNPDVSESACDQPTGYVADNTDDNDSGSTASASVNPTSAYEEFDANNVTVSFDGNEVTIVSNGNPNHTSPYWSSDSDLYIDPVVADAARMSPGTIREGSYSVTLPIAPQKASNTTATGLGAIGIAVTGVPIFNDEEGPNIALSENVASGFDYAGGHMGPTGYHYHLESQDVEANTTLSFDDEKLVGILQDGFFLYGRRCSSTGEHPTDLDESGGHTSSTQHSDEAEFYHYHIINEFYTGSYIVLFGVDLQGTPNSIF